MELNVEALILFKEVSHLTLKSFALSVELSDIERKQINTALEYHRIYMSHKLSQSKPKED